MQLKNDEIHVGSGGSLGSGFDMSTYEVHNNNSPHKPSNFWKLDDKELNVLGEKR
jgi:hypothetical protein